MTEYLLFAVLLLPLLSAVVTLFADKNPVLMDKISLPLLGIGAALGVLLGVQAMLASAPLSLIYPLGLPWLHWHWRLDALAGFFISLISLVVLALSFYAPAYIRPYVHGKQPISVLGLFTGLFIATMYLVVLADDAFSFMLAWEGMSLSSYFLVGWQHQHAANRRAAFLYLLMAQIGGLAILLSFGILAAFGHGFTFDAMRGAPLSFTWASLAFALGLLGFGMKAGLVPVHAWLPQAHPVAPSHISALMSGVMLKVAVYGFMRLSFDLIGNVHWRWGVVLLFIGAVSALFGVLYALVQHDLKRLLAYHSVENIGIIFIGLGLSMIFYGNGLNTLGTLGLIAALYHTLNHALFKSLLFFGAGAVLQHTHEHDMEKMGGLSRVMPWTGLFFLLGCISISALPPFNGFVSEWLTFQTALQAPALHSGVLRALIPLAAASLALTGALAAACFVKVYGVSFLGLARSRNARHAREASRGMLVGQGLLALLCLLFGVFPGFTLHFLNHVSMALVHQQLDTATAQGWMWLTPVSAQTASYSAPWVFAGVLLALLAWVVVYAWLRPRGRAPICRGATWDCGFGALNARMQYGATAFAMPIRRIFTPVWRLRESIDRQPPDLIRSERAQIQYHLQAEDITWAWFYQPIERLLNKISRVAARIQTGHLRHYLAYTFITLILLLWLIT